MESVTSDGKRAGGRGRRRDRRGTDRRRHCTSEHILERLGYQPVTTPGMLYTTRSLNEPIPDKPLPEGFSMRPVAGEHEAGLVAEVHNGAFRPKWDAEQYLAVMRTPGFQINHELVVVAPDGRFAAFVIIWLDPISRTGLFEPVGCHRDFQRRGLTSALMYEGMRRMRAAGMETAIVCYHADNVSGVPLYRSVGFQTRYEITEYRKPIVASFNWSDAAASTHRPYRLASYHRRMCVRPFATNCRHSLNVDAIAGPSEVIDHMRPEDRLTSPVTGSTASVLSLLKPAAKMRQAKCRRFDSSIRSTLSARP